MEYIVERDLFMSKLQNYLNEKSAEGYELVNTCVSELDVKEGRNGQYMQASKITVIMAKK
jgi:hypothetical protein